MDEGEHRRTVTMKVGSTNSLSPPSLFDSRNNAPKKDQKLQILTCLHVNNSDEFIDNTQFVL